MPPLPAAPTPADTSMALVKIAGLVLFLPQSDIVAIEARASVDGTEPGARSVGWIVHAQQRWPVYCLSGDLSLLFQVPAGRRACVLLALGGNHVGFLCDEVKVSQPAPAPTYPLPDAMHVPATPIRGVAAMGAGVACLSDGPALAGHIERMAGR